MLVTSIYSFSKNVFLRLLYQSGLCGKGFLSKLMTLTDNKLNVVSTAKFILERVENFVVKQKIT